ncbi:RHS repeat-associated core domain-containing protein [Kribbella sp. CA-293567]|uniref:RHS repeat-associated core domain-containing protein n=1 Tax=Kribbella sp. CA-293567 TaxID=3002436 RepID=UPI0022DDACE8|nr:RHS repeat-associated core domain-containing protein [Kribbella sp. CA-293567]WBQ07544.1 polymorphic toxin-type HINT domain-containing protein [Kribbella sp. CA-293567]
MHRSRSARAALVTVLGVSLIAGVGTYVPEAEAKTPSRPAPAVKQEKPTPGKDFQAGQTRNRAGEQSAEASKPQPRPEWPAASTSVVGTTVGKSAPNGQRTVSPVSVTAAAAGTANAATLAPSVKIDVLSQAEGARLGVEGVAIRLARTDTQKTAAKTKVSVDYSKFASAFGGNWSNRLRIVELTCVAGGACSEKRVLPGAGNDSQKKTVSADLDLPAVPAQGVTAKAGTASFITLAVAAGASGSAGSYAATPLAASSTWNVGVQTGDFSWSYPLRVPPGTAGPRPDLSIGYSSGSVDGQVASSNNQTSWVGQGHSLEPGFIERKYVSCADDMVNSNTTVKTGDLCWKTDNAVLSLGGHSGELVKVAADTFKLRNDDGSRIQRVYSAGNANGARAGEYWVVTTSDGTHYYFGSNVTISGTDRTNSVNTVPVFGNQVGEPCRAATFAASYCQQAWRWNLDRVVDVNGNLMTYRYIQENNYYGRNNNTGVSLYQRASYPWIVDYGKVTATETTKAAPARAWFEVAERCLPGGAVTCAPAQLTAANAANWPDVPFDQICTSATSCPNRTSPSFFSRKRLAKVNTETLNGNGWLPVDTWTLTQDYPPSGDTDRSLFLRSITHQGRAGGTLTNPSVSFVGIDKPNRVDAIGDAAPAMNKWRVSSISSESGQVTNVNYSAPDCTPTTKPALADAPTNTKRCFPVYWTIDGGVEPTLHWFNKYVVTSVVVADSSTDGLDQGTFYEYLGTPAWHFDDNELTLLKYRSWGDWRGYSKVNVETGPANHRTRTQYTFFRGMHGDYLNPQGTAKKTVSVTDSQGDAMLDALRLNGFTREQITYNGAGGPEVSGTISTPWTKQTGAGDGAVSTLLQTKSTSVRTRLSSGAYRTVGTATEFDDFGMPASVDDLGDIAVANDDRCTRFTYNRNEALQILGTVSREEKVSVGCSATPNRPTQVISDERSYYDGNTDLNAAPVDGLVTKVETMSGWSNGPQYEERSRTTYDSLGRVKETHDGLGRKTSAVTYTPATGGPVTGRAVADAKGYVSSTIIHPAWGATVAEVDPNGRRTDLTYDAFGRLTGVWLPNRSKAGGATASMLFSYLLSKTAPNVVATQELLPNGTYKTSRTLFDGLLRQRQVQTPAATGVGRVIADTTYDYHGNVATQTGAYYDDKSAPTNTLFDANEPNLPGQTVNTYDGANRPVISVFNVQGHEQWRTQTIYGGNATAVIPPSGGTTSMQLFDARGKVSELRQYHGAAAGGDFDSTKYSYRPDGQLETIVNAAGSVWRYAYDIRGRQISSADPDKGTTTSTYDNADRLVSTKDARNQSIFYSYDELDRKTAARSGSATGTVLASWVYDTLGKGLLTSSTRTVDGNNYVNAVNGYDLLDRPIGTSVTIPASEGKLAGTYSATTTYNPDGSVNKAKLPTTPGLPDETITMEYDAFGNADGIGGWQSYVAGTKYGEYGDPLQYRMGQASEKSIYQSFEYEQGTRRLAKMDVDRSTVAAADDTFDYTYDDASNVTSVTHTMGATVDRQCYANDYLRRTTEAWTPAGTCAAARSAAILGGPAPYWQSYNYDKSGNRTSIVDHKVAGDSTSTYTYPAATAARPHAVTAVNGSGPGGTSVDNYGYDAAGNLSSRTVGGDSDTLAWDAEGHLSSVSGPAGDTDFIYDAEGNRLIRHDPKGSTLYLASAEVRWDKVTDKVKSTRYYDFNGKTVAMRNDALTVEYLMADPQGTSTVAVDGSTTAISRRYMDPFGNSRGAPSPTWEPNSHGFVNGVDDPSTGLTHLGAREYDAKLGRFISVDPLVDIANPQTLNAYSYSIGNPATFSDPDGLIVKPEGGPRPVVPTVTKPERKKTKTTAPAEAAQTEAVQQAVAAVTHHREVKEEAKRVIKRVIKDLVKIVADEIGVTDALNCFTDGDLGACASTGVTVLSSFAGGVAGKLVSKYLFHAKKAWKLVGRIKDLIGEAIDGIKGYRKAEEGLRKAEEAVSAACVTNSFTPGTLVLLADGRRRAIERLTTEDVVLTSDPVARETTGGRIARTIVGEGSKDLVDIELTTASPGGMRTVATITATVGHPFYVPELARWVDAGELSSGVRLESLNRQAIVTVNSVRRYSAQARVHNLTTGNFHTYYVAAGNSSVLVHNCPAGGSGEAVKRSRGQDLSRDLSAVGDHSVFERGEDGVIARYQTFIKNDRNPVGWDKGPRFRGTGGNHAGMSPPLYYPTGRGRAIEGKDVPDRIPRGYLSGGN